jgi:hypothetical protein
VSYTCEFCVDERCDSGAEKEGDYCQV